MYMTPNCMDGMPGKSQKALDYEYTHRKGRKSPNNLRDQIAVDAGERHWRTPASSDGEGGIMQMYKDKTGHYKLRDQVQGINEKFWPEKQLPTPRASEGNSRSSKGTKSHKHQLGRFYLTAVIKENEPVGGQLNPDWTECLMGWPPGWTSLEPLPLEVWAMWERQFNNWWPSHGTPFYYSKKGGLELTGRIAMAWHCLELIYPRLTTIKEHRTNRLKAIGNGQVAQSKVKAILLNMEAR